MENTTSLLWNGTTTNTSSGVSTHMHDSTGRSESYFSSTNINTEAYTGTSVSQITPRNCSSSGDLVSVAIVTAVVSLSALVIGLVLMYLRVSKHRRGSERFKSYIKCSEDLSDEALDDVFYSNGTEMHLITDLNDKETTTTATTTITTTKENENGDEKIVDAKYSNKRQSKNSTPAADSNADTSIRTTVLITSEGENERKSASIQLSNQNLQISRCNSSVGSNPDQQTDDATNTSENLDNCI